MVIAGDDPFAPAAANEPAEDANFIGEVGVYMAVSAELTLFGLLLFRLLLFGLLLFAGLLVEPRSWHKLVNTEMRGSLICKYQSEPSHCTFVIFGV